MNKKVGFILLGVLLLSIVGIVLCFQQGKKVDHKKFSLASYYYTDEADFISVTPESLNALEENYILYTYNSFCSFPISCDSIFKEFMETYHIAFLSIPFADFKETSFYSNVKYAPSILIVQNKKVVAYLDADADEDIDKYQDVEALKEWLEEFIYFEKE